jgi:hypothetical protein
MGDFDDRCVNPGDVYDREGYDMYGYNVDNIDRDSKTENDYNQEALCEFLVDEGRGNEIEGMYSW